MSKEKKISFRYYLNKRLKPISSPDGDQYPVYLQVTYNRLNNQFKIGFIEHPYYTENEFERLFVKRSDPKFNKTMDYYEEQLKSVIRFEIKSKEDIFSIKGFSNRLDYYLILDTLLAIQYRCRNELIKTIQEHYTETEIIDSIKLLEFDPLRFVFLYFMIKNNFDPGIRDKVSKEFSFGCKALVYFNTFLDSSLSRDLDDMAIRWITHEIARRFFWYLESQDSKKIEKEHFPNMTNLLKEFGPISELEYGSVIGFITRAIIQ